MLGELFSDAAALELSLLVETPTHTLVHTTNTLIGSLEQMLGD